MVKKIKKKKIINKKPIFKDLKKLISHLEDKLSVIK